MDIFYYMNFGCCIKTTTTTRKSHNGTMNRVKVWVLLAGDYPLKDRKLVTAEPDILTFNLAQQKSDFVVLASDGLWDAFDNEQATTFLRERYNM